MTPDELAAIEARANAATPGPWTVEEDGNWVYGKGCELADIYGGNTTLDATFIAAARQDVPTLVAEVRRLQVICGEDGTRPIEITGPMARRVAETMHVLGTEPPFFATVMVDGRRREVVSVSWAGPGQVEKIVVQP